MACVRNAMTRCLGVAGTVGLVGTAVLPAAAAELIAHRAVYDLSLSRAEASTSLVSAEGRLVFEINGSACAGYTVDFRNVTRVTDREGTGRVTDLRSSTFETLAPPLLDFAHETHIDGDFATGVEGVARATAAGVTVTISEPKQTEMMLRRAIFPTAHTALIIDAAETGERFLEATVYDGGDEADAVYETATVIGPGATDLPGASAGERAALSQVEDIEGHQAWRLVITYFQEGAAEGERQPEYELTFTLLDNGISYDVSFNYGAFSLDGELTELSLGEAPPCSAKE
ncbi:MAG: cell envelope integrity EipB family protein [Acuticoccus sp.]